MYPHCTKYTAMQGESTQVNGALLNHIYVYECVYNAQIGVKILRVRGNWWVTRKYSWATDPENISPEIFLFATEIQWRENISLQQIQKSINLELHPISSGCTSMIANCHKCEQRNRLNKIFALTMQPRDWDKTGKDFLWSMEATCEWCNPNISPNFLLPLASSDKLGWNISKQSCQWSKGQS